MSRERGFALLTALWLITALSAVVGLGLAATRLGQRTSLNRIVLTRGRWAAEACLAIAQARWSQRRLPDTATIDLGRTTRCAWRVEDPGTRINVNTADRELLERLLGDRMLAAEIVAARQAASFSSLDQAAPLESLATVLTVDGPGTINLNAAAAAVILALPGLTPEAVERLEARRVLGRPMASLDQLAGELSPSARAALLARYADLAGIVTFAPSRLVITADGWVQGEAPRATIEIVTVPLPERLAIVRRRMW